MIFLFEIVWIVWIVWICLKVWSLQLNRTISNYIKQFKLKWTFGYVVGLSFGSWDMGGLTGSSLIGFINLLFESNWYVLFESKP